MLLVKIKQQDLLHKGKSILIQLLILREYIGPFFKEFRVVGQICREGIDESAILPKARYAITVFHCME